MHSSLLLLEPLKAIVSTQNRQTQSTLITNLTCQTRRRIAPLELHQAWLSRHPKGIRNRGLPPSTCSAVLQNQNAVALVIPTDMEGKLQEIWRCEDSTVSTFKNPFYKRKFLLEYFGGIQKSKVIFSFRNSLQKAFTILNPSSGNSHLSSPVAVKMRGYLLQQLCVRQDSIRVCALWKVMETTGMAFSFPATFLLQK